MSRVRASVFTRRILEFADAAKVLAACGVAPPDAADFSVNTDSPRAPARSKPFYETEQVTRGVAEDSQREAPVTYVRERASVEGNRKYVVREVFVLNPPQ